MSAAACVLFSNNALHHRQTDRQTDSMMPTADHTVTVCSAIG